MSKLRPSQPALLLLTALGIGSMGACAPNEGSVGQSGPHGNGSPISPAPGSREAPPQSGASGPSSLAKIHPPGVVEHCDKQEPGDPQVRGYVFEDLGPDFSTSPEDVNNKHDDGKASDPRFENSMMLFAGAVGDREQSCDNGDTTFRFQEHGLQFMQPRVRPEFREHSPDSEPFATTHNVSPNLMAKLAKLSQSKSNSHRVTITSIGDSITKFETEDLDTFTEQFAAALAKEVGKSRVRHYDHGVSGSTSSWWLPDHEDQGFERFVRPVAKKTDLFVLTLGGNDVKRHAEKLLKEEGICKKVKNIQKLSKELESAADEALDNIEDTIHKIFELNGYADVMLMLYIDFPRSTRWQDYVEQAAPLGCKTIIRRALRKAVQAAQSRMRVRAAKLDVVILDLHAPSQELESQELSKLLLDPIHFSQAGHDFAFDGMLKSLGAFYSSPKRAPRFRFGLIKDVM